MVFQLRNLQRLPASGGGATARLSALHAARALAARAAAAQQAAAAEQLHGPLWRAFQTRIQVRRLLCTRRTETSMQHEAQEVAGVASSLGN